MQRRARPSSLLQIVLWASLGCGSAGPAVDGSPSADPEPPVRTVTPQDVGDTASPSKGGEEEEPDLKIEGWLELPLTELWGIRSGYGSKVTNTFNSNTGSFNEELHSMRGKVSVFRGSGYGLTRDNAETRIPELWNDAQLMHWEDLDDGWAAVARLQDDRTMVIVQRTIAGRPILCTGKTDGFEGPDSLWTAGLLKMCRTLRAEGPPDETVSLPHFGLIMTTPADPEVSGTKFSYTVRTYGLEFDISDISDNPQTLEGAKSDATLTDRRKFEAQKVPRGLELTFVEQDSAHLWGYYWIGGRQIQCQARSWGPSSSDPFAKLRAVCASLRAP